MDSFRNFSGIQAPLNQTPLRLPPIPIKMLLCSRLWLKANLGHPATLELDNATAVRGS